MHIRVIAVAAGWAITHVLRDLFKGGTEQALGYHHTSGLWPGICGIQYQTSFGGLEDRYSSVACFLGKGDLYRISWLIIY